LKDSTNDPPPELVQTERATVLTRRLVVCLDVKGGRVVKGTQFRRLRDIGDPVRLAGAYERAGADEIVFLDISASLEERGTLLDMVRRTAQELFIPLTVGGGIRSLDDIAATLRAGADKVSMNSAAVANVDLLTHAATRFGTQCVVASIDARRNGAGWQVCTHGGSRPTSQDAIAWAMTCAAHGAGEILLTSIDRDGSRSGYDLVLTRNVSSRVQVPVVASGGAGGVQDVVDVFRDGGADAALVAGLVHDGGCTVAELKAGMAAAGLPVRTFP
jgi:imidazole glycerol-phosphate synthase subunit HisF